MDVAEVQVGAHEVRSVSGIVSWKRSWINRECREQCKGDFERTFWRISRTWHRTDGALFKSVCSILCGVCDPGGSVGLREKGILGENRHW